MFGLGRKKEIPSRADYEQMERRLEQVGAENVAMHANRDEVIQKGHPSDNWDSNYANTLKQNHAVKG